MPKRAGNRIGRITIGGLCAAGLAAAAAFAAAPAALANGGGYEVAFQDSNGDLWTHGTYNNGDSGVAVMSGTSPSISVDN